MIGKARIFESLERLLKRLPGDQLELVYTGGRSDLTRYTHSEIHQNVSVENMQIYIRVALGKRLGVVVTNTLEEGPLLEAAKQAIELARHQPENPFFEGFPHPAEYERTKTYFEATAKFTPQQRAEMVKRVFAEAERLGFEVSGAFSTSAGEVAVLNSNGLEAYQPLTGAEISLVPVSREGMGYADAFSHDVTALDFERLTAKALERCSLNKSQREIPLGQYDVILEPGCLAEVMRWLNFIAFRAQAFIEGTSFLSGRLGERAMGENITIYDSVHEPEAEGLPFDFQGSPKRKVTLIERGINRGVVFDLMSAKQVGAEPTGHAGPPDSPYGPMPWNICMAPGDSSLEEMIASCERGLLVTRFHYLNGFLDPKRAMMTGMTRYGTFLVEDGKLKHAVKNLRWTESMLRAFSNVRAISREREVFSYGGAAGFAVMPAVYIEGFTFTGVQEEGGRQ